MKKTRLHLLFELACLGCGGASARITTIELANSLGVSQQTASRWLSELARERLVKREGKTVRLTRQARQEIEALAKLLEAEPNAAKRKLVLRGVVVRGLGEGAKFLSLPGYAKQLHAALSWKPFPGTLNLKLDENSSKVKKRLESLNGIKVKSFVAGNKRFGSVKLFPCVVKSNGREERGAVILPEKSFYGESILELIAPFNMRSRLAAKDGSAVGVILVFE